MVPQWITRDYSLTTIEQTDRVKLVNKSVHLDDKSHTIIGELYEQELSFHC